MGLRLITAPTFEPITVADLKLQARIDSVDEDSLLALYIKGAREHAEGYLEAAIPRQTWEQTLDSFPLHEIELKRPPQAAIVSVIYRDTAGALQTLDPSNYVLDVSTWPGWLLPAFNVDWPSTQDSANAVVIRFTTGYADAGAVPQDIKDWMLMTCALMHSQREAMDVTGRMQDVPARFVIGKLDRYKVWGL
jgi:uncharacterized phiE125 gp8 family phage protein